MISVRLFVVCQIVASVAVQYGVFKYFYYTHPLKVPEMPLLIDRLAFTLRWQTFPALTLLLGINTVTFERFTTAAIDPIRGPESSWFKSSRNFLQNTLEQLVISCIGQLILVTYLGPEEMRAVPILAGLFVLGRIFFWLGYKRAYYYRGFGFAMTFIPIAIVYVINVTYFILSGNVTTLFDLTKASGMPKAT